MTSKLIPKPKKSSLLITELYKQKLQNKLQSLLPRAPEPALYQFVELYMKAEMPERSLALQLLDKECGSNEILMVLIYCRNLVLMLKDRVSAEEDSAYLKKVLIHHDHLSVWLMQAVEEKREAEWKELQAQLLQEEYHHRLTRACFEWSKEKEIRVYNYYKEMPVTASLKLLKVGANSFTVRRSEDLIAVVLASDTGCSLYTDMPGCEISMEMTVSDATHDAVHLQYGEFVLAKKQRRREPRVTVSSTVHAILRDAEFRSWECEVSDLSASGLGLLFRQEMSFQKGDAFVFSLWLHGEKIIGRCMIAWLRNSEGKCYAGVSLEYNKVRYRQLSSEVSKLKRKSLMELKLRGLPNCLL